MRIPVSRKVLLVFAALALVTGLLGVVLQQGLEGLHRAADEVLSLTRFQLRVQKLELVTDTGAAQNPEAARLMLQAEIEALRRNVDELLSLHASVPLHLQTQLAALDSQIEFYRQAAEELFAKRAVDHDLHMENHTLLEEAAQASAQLDEATQRQVYQLLALAEALWSRSFHDRDPQAVGSAQALARRSRELRRADTVHPLFGRFVDNVERSYFNYLAIREREAFLRTSATRFPEVAAATIKAISRDNLETRKQLSQFIALSLAAALLLTLVLWAGSTRYLRRFLSRSHRAMESIRAGTDLPELRPLPDDELGDLTLFMAEVASSRKQVMAQLAASEERYRRLVEELDEWVWEVDPQGRFTYCSPVVERLLGMSVADACSASLPALLCGEAEAAETCREQLLRNLAQRDCPTEISHPDGSTTHLESTWGPLLDPTGTVQGLRGITRDVSARKLAEAEKARLEAQLVHAQKMEAIGTLSGGVAHDFNNLLQSISGYAELLLRRLADDPANRRFVQTICDATERAAQLTRQLLLFSRRIESRFRPVDVNEQVRSVCEMLRQTIPRMVEIHTHLADGVPEVLADPNQLEQVVVNLALNARDAMPHGGELTFETELRDLRQDTLGHPPGEIIPGPGPYLLLRVSDTGSGMPPEVRERIFEPFFTTKEVGKGTGLGLAMVYGIVKGHSGHIDCVSQPGQGTTFTLYLPIRPPSAEVSAEAAPPTPSAAVPAVEGATLLVVDDEEWLRDLGREFLSAAGYSVLTAASGEEALTLCAEHPIDLVLLDLNMPGMGGTECLQRLLEKDPGLKVLISTGHSEQEYAQQDVLRAAHGWVRKPYRLDALAAQVRTALQPIAGSASASMRKFV